MTSHAATTTIFVVVAVPSARVGIDIHCDDDEVGAPFSAKCEPNSRGFIQFPTSCRIGNTCGRCDRQAERDDGADTRCAAQGDTLTVQLDNVPDDCKSERCALAPTLFEVTTVPNGSFLAFPEVNSERRDYVPIGWLAPLTIPSNKLLIFQTPERYLFGILSSNMHTAWLRNIGGRLESRYQYSIGIVYNPFPWPPLDEVAKAKTRKACENRAGRARGA